MFLALYIHTYTQYHVPENKILVIVEALTVLVPRTLYGSYSGVSVAMIQRPVKKGASKNQ